MAEARAARNEQNRKANMAQINIPGFKAPSGTIYNDLIALVVAVVALLKALGVI